MRNMRLTKESFKKYYEDGGAPFEPLSWGTLEIDGKSFLTCDKGRIVGEIQDRPHDTILGEPDSAPPSS